ncbi:MAG TPA: branched-chain amino acid ABC transporter permease [Chloroflexota bacterium]|nr:branched-chain amino acid ABC transporter permease [Chloroflexota bacterium]
MTPAIVIQQLAFGVFVGGTYGLAAAGLSLVFGVLKVLNVAHGELLMLGGYVSFALFTGLGIDPFLSMLVSAPLLMLLGLALNQGLFSFVEKLDEENKIKNSLLISFGLTLVLQQAALTIWAADDRSVQTVFRGNGVRVFDVLLPYTRIVALALAAGAILGLDQVLRRTYFGKAVRATAEDWQAAALAGVDIQRMYLITFGIGAALAGLAGSLVSITYSIAPSIGAAWMLKALVVVVLAGMGSIRGALVAGLLLGVTESVAVFIIPAAYREVVGLVLFLLVLLLRPQGLFGTRLR